MNCYRVLRGCMFVVLFLASFIPFQHTSVQAAGAIWYVKADASGANTGTSWADAFTDLHAALSAAEFGLPKACISQAQATKV
jgi:hypothetical protein